MYEKPTKKELLDFIDKEIEERRVQVIRWNNSGVIRDFIDEANYKIHLLINIKNLLGCTSGA